MTRFLYKKTRSLNGFFLSAKRGSETQTRAQISAIRNTVFMTAVGFNFNLTVTAANKSAVSFEVFKHNLIMVAGFEFIKNMLDFTVSAD